MEVKYASCREAVKDGDVLLFVGKGIISRLIRWISGRYSHSGIAAWWGTRLMVLEAIATGVVAVPLSRCVQGYPVVDLYTTDMELDRDRVVDMAREELGKSYAYWGLFRYLKRFWLKLRGGADPQGAPDKFVCSQYVSYAYRFGGIDLVPGQPDSLTSPTDLAKSKYLRKVASLTS